MAKQRLNPITGQFNLVGLDDANLTFATHEIKVKQNPANGEFSTINEALASITDNDINNRYVIRVFAGTYLEPELDFAAKPYISLVGSSIQSVVIKPSGNHHIIKLGTYNEVSFLWLEDAPSGYFGIAAEDTGIYSQCHKVTFNNCNGVLVTSATQETQFFGEYIDFNGTFTNAVKVQATNGFLASVNLENFYIYPTAIVANAKGVYATGAGADVRIHSAEFSGFSNTGCGVCIEDGAVMSAKDTITQGFEVGLDNPNVGDPCDINIAAKVFKNNITDIQILHPNTSGSFIGISDHQKVVRDSSDFVWSYLDSNDGEFEVTRKISMTFDDGTHTDVSTLALEGSTMGVIEGGTLSDGGGFDIDILAGFGYYDQIPPNNVITKKEWNSDTITLSANQDLYIYFNTAGNLTTNGSRPDGRYNIVLGRVVTDGSGILFIDQAPINAEHTSNRFARLFREGLGCIYASGSAVSENVTPFKLDVTSGVYFYSTNRYTPSGGMAIDFIPCYDGLSHTATDTITNSYDNAGVLTAIPANKYVKCSLYVCGESTHEKYFLVYGTELFNNLTDAQNGDLPLQPTFIKDSVCPIAAIILHDSDPNIQEIENIKPVIGFTSSGSSTSNDHTALLNLTSGNAGHTQFMMLDGSTDMSNNLGMGGNNITNVGLVDGVDVSAHESRHLPNGSDPLTTAAPTTNLGGSSTNAVGNANSFARSNHSHAIDIANTFTTGLLTNSDWNYFTNKQDELVSGTNIKTIEGQSLLGSGNIDLTKSDVGLSNVVNADTTTTANITDSTNKRFVTDAELTAIGTIGDKLDANAPITGATKTKITYDVNGLITSGADATTADISDSTNKRYVTDAELTVLSNTSGTNTGDQTTIVGITGTKTQFDNACTDGNFLFVGDVTQYTDELAQDAVGAMVDTTLVYVDNTPLLTRAELTGDVTAPQGSNITTISNDAVTNAKLANMATQTFKGRTTAGTGDPEDLTIAEAKALLNLSGTNTGDQTTITGNAGTATALQTARNINGVSFDGTADITVTAAAGTLSGTTLNATVVTSSLTTVGTLASPTLTTPTINGSKSTGVNKVTKAVVTGNIARTINGSEMAAGSIQQLTGTVNRTFTLDSGTNLSTAVGSVAVGDSVQFLVVNSSTATITMNGGTGTTLANAMTIATLQSRLLIAVNTGTNTWTIY